jgi:hypothetical protein
VSNGVPIAATASPVPARNTPRRVRIVGGLIMSTSRLKGLRASAEAVTSARDVKDNVDYNRLCQQDLGKIKPDAVLD